jgi:hypothetical protein
MAASEEDALLLQPPPTHGKVPAMSNNHGVPESFIVTVSTGTPKPEQRKGRQGSDRSAPTHNSGKNLGNRFDPQGTVSDLYPTR